LPYLEARMGFTQGEDMHDRTGVIKSFNNPTLLTWSVGIARDRAGNARVE